MLPALQPPTYASAEGWTTFIVLVLAEYEDHLRLPSQFVEAMESQEMAYVMSTHASILVDSVGPPSAEVCRTAPSFS
jgi:hypothetical protein